MSKEAIKNLKSGNYEIVDSQGVSVTTHFIECLEKEFADLEAKLAEYEEIMKKHNIVGISKLDACLRDYLDINEDTVCGKMIKKLKQQLAEKEKEIEELNHKLNVEQPCLLMNYKDMVDMLKKSQNQTAIAELQKVLEWLNIPFDENGCLKNGEDLENYIDQQIAELKGEK